MPFFVYPPSHSEARYIVNPIRIVQCIFCVLCLALTIYFLTSVTYIFFIIFLAIIAITSAAFFCITLTDIITTTYYRPILWSTWAIFAIVAVLFFFLSMGLLIATYTGGTVLLVISEVIFGITAILFLIDLIMLLRHLRNRDREVAPYYEEEEERPRSPRTARSPRPKPQPKQKPEPKPRQEKKRPVKEEPKKPPPRETRERRRPVVQQQQQQQPTTYGGTFPVAKDEPPLPGPESGDEPPPMEKLGRGIIPGADGQLYTRDGILLTPIMLDTTKAYQGSNGQIYDMNGDPLRPEEVTAFESGALRQEPDGKIYNKDNVLLTPERRCGVKIYKGEDGRWYDNTGKIMTEEEVTKLSTSGIQRGCDGRLYTKCGTPVTPVKVGNSTAYKGADGLLYDGCGEPLSPRDIAQLEGRAFYRGADGQLYSTETNDRITTIPCRPCDRPPCERSPCERSPCAPVKSIQMGRTVSVSTRMVPKCGSRPSSHPSSPEGERSCRPARNVKSADPPSIQSPAVAYQYQEQKPSAVYHQYYQKPCSCGQVHYQTATTVHGTVVSSSAPMYPICPGPASQPAPPPCPSGSRHPPDCTCCECATKSTDEHSDDCLCSHCTEQESRKCEAIEPKCPAYTGQTLQPIRECDTELEAESLRWCSKDCETQYKKRDKEEPTTSETSPAPESSSEYYESDADIRSYVRHGFVCKDKRCPLNKGQDEAQCE